MFCPKCGSPAADGAKFCANCGSPLAAPVSQAAPVQEPVPAPQPIWKPDPEAYRQQPCQQQAVQQPFQQPCQQPSQQSAAVPIEAAKRSGKKGVLIGLGCLVLAALVVGGIWFLNRLGGSENKLIRAARNSFASFQSYTESLPNLHQIAENVEGLEGSEQIHLDYTRRNQMRYGYSENDSFEFGYDLHMDADRNAQAVALDGTIDASGTEVPIQLYLNEDQLQAGSDLLLGENEVFFLPLKDLSAQWNASALSEMTGVKLPEDLKLGKIMDNDWEAALKEVHGEDWTTFRSSVRTAEYKGTSPFEGKGKTYALTWDRESLGRMTAKAPDINELLRLGADGPESLSKYDYNELRANAIVAVLGEIDKVLKQEPLFYVENDLLVGIRAVIERENDDLTEITVRLVGEENPWEHITVKIRCGSDEDYEDEIVDVKLTAANGKLRIDFTHREENSDGYVGDEETAAFVYNDADGRITLEDNGDEVGENILNIFLTPVDGGFRFSVKTSYEEDDFYSYVTEAAYVVSNRIGEIAPLSDNPTNILKLTGEELRDLMDRIEEKINRHDMD